MVPFSASLAEARIAYPGILREGLDSDRARDSLPDHLKDNVCMTVSSDIRFAVRGTVSSEK